MKKCLSILALLGTGLAFALPQASAETAASHHKPVKKVAKKAEQADQIDVKGLSRVDYKCDLGNQITVYEHPNDNKRIGLRWNKKLHELTRVDTTTGANRFEDKKSGLVWIGIPAKSMLLDAKKGRPLANECKNPQQMKA
ncbi:hypothetical protein [Noviherbaspirillum massiliense]|uniref:hypothetical protein n=1 Tax=Noviherbaspirillum massiliense TaxID=1465823 RepID=UPI00031F7B09|nr:hypothetical protein [Noviherbaspirillum massiliense]